MVVRSIRRDSTSGIRGTSGCRNASERSPDVVNYQLGPTLLPPRTRSVAVFTLLQIQARQMIHYLGYLAGTLTVLAFLPQVIHTWQSRRTGDLSLRMLAILIAASTLWIIYGIVIH